MDDNFIYVPVAIPTLNRYKHLKRCIESLERCTWADRTEIYISIDCPYSEKQIEGYKLVLAYVKNKDWSAFKCAHIFYQDTNLGQSANMLFLWRQISEYYDCYISVEDDCEFMPAFLTYIDRGYNIFNKDPDFVGLSGGSGVNSDIQGYIKGKKISSGLLVVPEKNIEILDGIQHIFKNRILSGREIRKIYRHSIKLFYYYVQAYLIEKKDYFFRKNGDIASIDIAVEIYLILFDKYSIYPAKSLLKNWGYDGSGLHCYDDENIEKDLKLDMSKEYKFTKEVILSEKEEWRKDYDINAKLFYNALFKYVMIRIFGLGLVRKIRFMLRRIVNYAR